MKKDSEPVPMFAKMIDLTDGGLAHIKKAEDSSGQIVVLKLYQWAGMRAPPLNLANYRCEVAALSRLSHPSIIRLHAFCENWIYRSPHGVDYNSLLIVLEHCPHGDLFDMISQSGRFSEALARSYFRQLLDAIGSCHQAGIIHRDLKPENLLLGENFELKLADFGSAVVPGVEPCETFGTTSYLPPEGSATPFAPAIDLYSCGIILYFMLTRELPFAKPTQQDLRYKLFQTHRTTFWGAKKYLSATSRDLIEALMHENPSVRLTLPQVLAHPWLAEGQLTPDEVRSEMVARKARIR